MKRLANLLPRILSMSRNLAYCQNCDKEYIVEVNGHRVVTGYEEIPLEHKESAHHRRLTKPGSDLFVFGGCPGCGRPGWPGMLTKNSFRGLV